MHYTPEIAECWRRRTQESAVEELSSFTKTPSETGGEEEDGRRRSGADHREYQRHSSTTCSLLPLSIPSYPHNMNAGRDVELDDTKLFKPLKICVLRFVTVEVMVDGLVEVGVGQPLHQKILRI